MKKYLLVLLLITIIVPSVASAYWDGDGWACEN